jgi:cob(I)alamin adenosyltransferase
MAKIYTKTGDKGSTSLLGGTRVDKNHARIDAYGTVDELNAHVGLLIDHAPKGEWCELLEKIQRELFVLGSHLANESPEMEKHLPKVDVNLCTELEKTIDKYTAVLPELKHFILPGGHVLVSQTHICRTVCRRAEREAVSLSNIETVSKDIIVLLNRLSDFFFVLGRYVGLKNNVPEKIWNP